MSAPFFITGLPRSRTAWLANLFTTERSLCHHDLHRGQLGALENLLELWRGRTQRLEGFSDPLLTLLHGQIKQVWPTARWLYIERDPQECRDSYLRLINPIYPDITPDQVDHLIEAHQRAAENLKSIRPLVLTVQYEQLNRYGVIAAAWYHVLPEVPFDVDRWKMLLTMNIQAIPRKVTHQCQPLGS